MARSDPAGAMSVALASFSASSWEGNGPISVSSPPSVSEYEHQNHVSPRLTMLKGIASSVTKFHIVHKCDFTPRVPSSELQGCYDRCPRRVVLVNRVHAPWLRPTHSNARPQAADRCGMGSRDQARWLLQVRRGGDTVRLFTRRGYDWSGRYPAIAATAAKLRAESFTLDGEAVVCGPERRAGLTES